MIHRINFTQDSTIYEDTIYQNTGGDQILEIVKTFSDGEFTVPLNSRFLLKSDLSEITSLINDGVLPTQRQFYLKLRITEPAAVVRPTTILINAVSESWDSGIAERFVSPVITDGVSWTYRDGVDGQNWITGSLASGTDGVYSTNIGGGTWYTGSEVSHTFTSETSDVSANVTGIVENWISGSIQNNGIIVRRDFTEESSSLVHTKLQFFSSETHTIYEPMLEIRWDDFTFSTGSLTQLNTTKDIFVYLPELKYEYRVGSKIKMRVLGRERYPSKSFALFNKYSTTNYLPTGSYYSIQDAWTKETVIPFDNTYTKLSVDPSGSFFNMWTDSLEPERFYNVIIKVNEPDGEVKYFNEDMMFKIIR